jgi:hypothetical protein
MGPAVNVDENKNGIGKGCHQNDPTHDGSGNK